MERSDLMAGPPPTLLPEDPAAASLASGEAVLDVVRRHPESPLAWATLAEQTLAEQTPAEQTPAEQTPAEQTPAEQSSAEQSSAEQSSAGQTQAGDRDVAAYAYARVGYHRSLDLLRRNGWKGHGPVPWEHEPNRGFLRALAALAVAAGRIGEDGEAGRCSTFLRDSSPAAFDTLLG